MDRNSMPICSMILNSEDEVYHFRSDAASTEDRKVPNKETSLTSSNEKVKTSITFTMTRLILVTKNHAKSLQPILYSFFNAVHGNDIIYLYVWIDRA